LKKLSLARFDFLNVNQAMASDAVLLGIIVCGGPAPGLNAVIAGATLYARRLYWTVCGFHDGFSHLASGDPDRVRANQFFLDEDIVSQSCRQGGSIIRMDRFDPAQSPATISATLNMLSLFRVKYVLIIGGNDKIMSTEILAQGVDPADMQFIVIPKTTDNDISLPGDRTTFGFDSARCFGTKIVKNLLLDAKSYPRYFIVETMGKRSGHLALSIAEASGAHVLIIPEDFGEKRIDFSVICDILEGAIVKRLSQGKFHGICIISEGLVYQMTSTSIQRLCAAAAVQYGNEGQISLDEVEMSMAMSHEVNKRLAQRGIFMRLTATKLGYEMRSQTPNGFDSVYSEQLGFGAVEGFRTHHSNCLVLWTGDGFRFTSIRSIMDPTTGRLIPRRVNVESEEYRVTREFLSILTETDFQDQAVLKRLAEAANVSETMFISRFSRLPGLTVR
jgi:6-phosphofructokinase 1